MKLAVTFTVYDRPKYFEQVLDSWAAVRGREDVYFYFSCEPYFPEGRDAGNPCSLMAEEWLKDNKQIGRVFHNSTKMGVLHNPYVALQRAFVPMIDYAVLAEDDLLVSDDILEYHKWASETYKDDKALAMVCSFSPFNSGEALIQAIIEHPAFASVWIWGTWGDRWREFIEPTWDHDYSTGNEAGPGGWDWHLNKRVLPSLGKKSLQPMVSRVQSIGVAGTHQWEGIPIEASPVFQLHREPAKFVELTSR